MKLKAELKSDDIFGKYIKIVPCGDVDGGLILNI